MRLRLGSRGSPLALWQSRHVAERLETRWPGLSIAIEIIKTEGDMHLSLSPAEGGGKGIFVKEIEDALLAGRIDLAVHSLKDLPTASPVGLSIAAIPVRHDPRDALVSPAARRVEDLPAAAVVATGSPRRRCQVLHVRPDLAFTAVRGNVDTRLRKLSEGRFDALVLAVAGLERLGLDAPYAPIPTDVCLPAPGQGALAIQARADDAATRAKVVPLDDPSASAEVAAERAFLAELEAGCLAPAAALGRTEGASLALEGMIGDPDGRSIVRGLERGERREAETLGRRLARRLLAADGRR